MNTQQIKPASTVSEIFDSRFKSYRKWTNILGSTVEKLFKHYAEVAISFSPGWVETGNFNRWQEDIRYILIQSKVGKIMVYCKPDETIHYICEEDMAICHSFKCAGFNGTSGQIDTVDKLNHIFAIPDSYLQ